MGAQKDNLRLLDIITGVFVTSLVIVPSASSKFIAVGQFNLPGATLIFPLAFIFNDLFTEVYGYSKSRRIIWTGMACQLLASFYYWLIGIWPAAPFWTNQAAYDTILGSSIRITIASVTAYFFGEFANSLVLSKMKYGSSGKRGVQQGWRFIASTVVGQAVDSVAFMGIGFLGVLTTPDLIKIIATIWAAKVLIEILALPINMRLANWIKDFEGVDKIDTPEDTNYSPFAITTRG